MYQAMAQIVFAELTALDPSELNEWRDEWT
jgi:hypothetical protein